MRCFLSICIPCNKRVAQVKYTLESIYNLNSDIPIDEYEVVISDNDPDAELQVLAEEYSSKKNFRYIRTKCEGFMNSYYALSYGEGEFLKLHNSQNDFKVGALKKILDILRDNRNTKPLFFFTNGLSGIRGVEKFYSYEEFMFKLSYLSSWSGGMTIWKQDFDSLSSPELDPLFPHTSIFASINFDSRGYIIDDRYMFDSQRISKRGGHNKFRAFTVNYPGIIDKLFREGRISKKCRDSIFKKIYTEFVPILLFNKYIARIETFSSQDFRMNSQVFFPRYSYFLSWLCVIKVPYILIKRRINQFMSVK